MKTINEAYPEILRKVLHKGKPTFPRGFVCKELDGFQVVLDMNEPVLTLGHRNCNQGFMVAEFLWILAGRKDVRFIEMFNKRMATFSDDGNTLYGAYGQNMLKQMSFCLKTLREDNDSRQAVMTFWKPSPKKSKDVPCTIGLHFMVRDGKLNCYSHMRSNDLWLGFPYDFYTFSMLSKFVADNIGVKLGYLVHNADSMHLYDEHLLKVKSMLEEPRCFIKNEAKTEKSFELGNKCEDAFEEFQLLLNEELEAIVEELNIHVEGFPEGIKTLVLNIDNYIMEKK